MFCMLNKLINKDGNCEQPHLIGSDPFGKLLHVESARRVIIRSGSPESQQLKFCVLFVQLAEHRRLEKHLLQPLFLFQLHQLIRELRALS